MNARTAIKVDKATFYRFIEAGPEGRYEFVRGWIVQQQQGGTLKHSRIGTRFVNALGNRLREPQWIVNGPDRGIDTGLTIRYADASVERAGAPEDSLSTDAPVVIVEVLSPSSEERDLTAKPGEYLQLATLEAYVVASQDEPACYVWTRDLTRQFPDEPVRIIGSGNRIEIPSLSVSIPLLEIYP